MNEVYGEVMKHSAAARMTVRIPPSGAGALVEIMMTARMDR